MTEYRIYTHANKYKYIDFIPNVRIDIYCFIKFRKIESYKSVNKRAIDWVNQNNGIYVNVIKIEIINFQYENLTIYDNAIRVYFDTPN